MRLAREAEKQAILTGPKEAREAVADDLNGEWRRFDKPLIDVTGNRMMTSTPTISKRTDIGAVRGR